MDSIGNFKVKVIKKDVVAAALPMQEHRLPLTNLDLLLPPLDVSVAFCYNHHDVLLTDSSFEEKVGFLKRALAQALVPFYAFSGEIVTNFSGQPEILCDNRGVHFIEAFADVNFRDLNLHCADKCLGKFMPVNKEYVLSVQVTELKCGAIMVACTFDHRVADACSANMFWVLWAEMTSNKPISVFPCFRRSLLSHRNPPHCHPLLDHMYLSMELNPKDPGQHMKAKTDSIVSRIYYVLADQLCEQQTLANKSTKFQSFCAFLWKLVASHACQTHTHNASKLCKMGIVVDGRTRLSDGEDENKRKALTSYFGNVLSIPFGQEQSVDLKDRPLGWVVNRVQTFLEPAQKKEHFSSLINWVEAHKPGSCLSRIYSNGNKDGPAFVVSSGLRFQISKVDFGWGKPIFGSYHFPWKGDCGYVMPMPSPKRNGDWVVYMQLLESQLNFIEANALHMFKPFSMDLICS